MKYKQRKSEMIKYFIMYLGFITIVTLILKNLLS